MHMYIRLRESWNLCMSQRRNYAKNSNVKRNASKSQHGCSLLPDKLPASVKLPNFEISVTGFTKSEIKCCLLLSRKVGEIALKWMKLLQKGRCHGGKQSLHIYVVITLLAMFAIRLAQVEEHCIEWLMSPTSCLPLEKSIVLLNLDELDKSFSASIKNFICADSHMMTSITELIKIARVDCKWRGEIFVWHWLPVSTGWNKVCAQ